MSYTLRGRIESRLLGALVALIGAAVLGVALDRWWPLVLTGLMVGVGLLLDAAVYHRLLPYQPAWVAVPLGAVELGAVMGLAIALDVGAPFRPAVALFVGAWLVAQLLAHAGFPLLRLTYGEDGGELGRLGTAATACCAAFLAFAGGIAWGTRPPTVHLGAGFHRGPIVLDHAQTLDGDGKAVIQGTVRITADHVILRDVTILAGENGVEVENAEHVLLDHVRVRGASADGIHVRQAQVSIRDCDIREPRGPNVEGIDISFAMDRPPSTVDECTVEDVQDGIVTHTTNVHVEDNVVRGTTGTGIAVTEMSMGSVDDNRVEDAVGIGIFCTDYSECAIERNTVTGMRPELGSSGTMRAGFGIVVHYGAKAEVGENILAGNGRRIGTFSNAFVRTIRD